jgi:hypothetical protein
MEATNMPGKLSVGKSSSYLFNFLLTESGVKYSDSADCENGDQLPQRT